MMFKKYSSTGDRYHKFTGFQGLLYKYATEKLEKLLTNGMSSFSVFNSSFKCEKGVYFFFFFFFWGGEEEWPRDEFYSRVKCWYNPSVRITNFMNTHD